MARIDVVRGSSVARLVLVLAALFVGPAVPERAFAQDDQGDDNSTNNPNPQPAPVAPGVRPPGLRDRLPVRPQPRSLEEEGTETSTSTSGAPPSPPTATTGAGGAAAGSAGSGASSGELGAPSDRAKPPEVQGAQRITLDMLSTNVYDLVKYYADITGRNAIIGDKKELQGAEVSIISNRPVGVYEAEKAIVAALEVAGYAIVVDGATVTVVKTGAAAQAAIPVRQGGDLPGSGFVTQIIPLENVSVGDVTTVISGLVSPDAKVLAYNPSNTLIITEQASNLRRVYSVIKQLDIAAPKSRLEVIPLIYANAEEVKAIVEQIYGTAAESTAPASATKKTTSTSTSASARRTPKREDSAVSSEAVSAGVESRYIDKVISDERTNALIVLADDQGHAAVRDIVAKLDVDVDPASRSQIHVVKLEHAKAEDVATVLANLSEGGSSSSKASSASRGAATTASARRPTAQAESPTTTDGNTGVLAAFDSGMRITHDETTNSLVIIAANDDFEIVKRVIDELDAKRRQVFVDCVVLELSSEDSFDLGLAYHGPLLPNNENLSIAGGQFGQSSLGLSQDLLSGLALGVYGETVEVPFGDGTVIPVPAFGIVLNALKTNSSVNIVSNPNLMTLDNEEAEIVVGRKIPFPTSSGLNSLGQPVISYQREDVAITLKMTPRINSENYVTMVIELEVSEVEEDDSALDPATAGFITSKREVKTTALVGDNQTVVLGGLVGTTDTEVETKVPILGDLPLIGTLFRGSRNVSRKTNLMVFLTPHIVDDESDFIEVMKVKEAQRQEFLRRFYGKSRDQQMEEIKNLLRYSMNVVDEPSYYRGSPEVLSDEITVGGAPISDETRAAIAEELQDTPAEVGSGAGALPVDDLLLDPGDDASPGGQ